MGFTLCSAGVYGLSETIKTYSRGVIQLNQSARTDEKKHNRERRLILTIIIIPDTYAV